MYNGGNENTVAETKENEEKQRSDAIAEPEPLQIWRPMWDPSL